MNAEMRRDEPKKWLGGMAIVFRDAIIATVISAAVAIVANLIHPQAIPFIAEKEYEILVPCPEPGGKVTRIEASDRALWTRDVFLVDARSGKEFSTWRFREATNLTYDYLDPTPENLIQDLARGIASSRAKKVIVYGDGDTPDTGEQLGKEISGHGIKNVFFLLGGAPALMAKKAPGGRK